jgi:uroporphyrinogen-III synthase/uroporphyrinogen III methyltransferase/synthase
MPEPRRTAILTRRPEDNARIAHRLRASGVEVLELPCMRVQPLEDITALADAIGAVGEDDWLVARAARPRCGVAAVGRVTAARLVQHGIAVAFQPRVPSGVALGRELPQARAALLARSDRALPDLPAILRSRGFEVSEVVAYRTIARADGDVAAVRAALADRACEVSVMVASPSAAEAFADAAGELAARATFHVTGAATEAFVRIRIPQARVERDLEVCDVSHR